MEAVTAGLPNGTTAQNWSTTDSYDPFGNRTSKTTRSPSPLTPTAEAQYDPVRNRLIFSTNAVATGSNPTPDMIYDGSGNLMTSPDGAGQTMQMSYDSENRLISSPTGGPRRTCMTVTGAG